MFINTIGYWCLFLDMPSLPSRHTVLAVGLVFALVGSSGCIGLASLPGGGCEPTRVTATPYPAVPATLTNETVTEYAEAFEQARLLERHAGDRKNFTYRIVVDSVNRTSDGWLVHLTGGVAERGCSWGRSYVGDGVVGAQYFINETTVYRVDAYMNAAADPRESGTEVVDNARSSRNSKTLAS